MGSETELIVNLDEFSELCGVTSETMRIHVKAIDGEPAWLRERGSRGRDYRIEPRGGLAWWKSKRQAEEAADEERLDQLRQLRLELVGDEAEQTEALSLSGKQRREEYAATLDRIKLRRTMGELIAVSELEQPLAHAVIELRRALALVPGEFAAVTGVGPEEIGELSKLIERSVNTFVSAVEQAGAAQDA